MPPKIRPKAIWPQSVCELKWWRVRNSAMSANRATRASAALLPLNRLHAAPVLPQWTSLKKPGMTVFSSSKASERNTCHLVNWSSANTTSASAAMPRLDF